MKSNLAQFQDSFILEPKKSDLIINFILFNKKTRKTDRKISNYILDLQKIMLFPNEPNVLEFDFPCIFLFFII